MRLAGVVMPHRPVQQELHAAAARFLRASAASGRQRSRQGETVDRLVEPALLLPENSKVVRSFREVGLKPQGLLVGVNRLRDPA